MIHVNLLWLLVALCMLIVPASSSSLPDYNSLGFESNKSWMNLGGGGAESISLGELEDIRLQNMDELIKIIHDHWVKIDLEKMETSDNKDLAKLIARRLIRQIEVLQPQASIYLLLISGLMPEQWERVLAGAVLPQLIGRVMPRQHQSG